MTTYIVSLEGNTYMESLDVILIISHHTPSSSTMLAQLQAVATYLAIIVTRLLLVEQSRLGVFLVHCHKWCVTSQVFEHSQCLRLEVLWW